MAADKPKKSIILIFKVHDYASRYFFSYQMTVDENLQFSKISQLLANAILKPKIKQTFEFMEMMFLRNNKISNILAIDTPKFLNLSDNQVINVNCQYIEINNLSVPFEEREFKIFDPNWIFGVKLDVDDFRHIITERYHYIEKKKSDE